MKNNYYILSVLLTAFALMIFTSCSDDNDETSPIGGGNAQLSMKVEGEEWTAAMTTLFTEEHETSELGEYYVVYINGSRIIDKNSQTEDDLVETIGFYINIPASKFNSPKGTYPIISNDDEMGRAWAVFGSSTDLRDTTTYISVNPDSPEQVVGSIEITDFETGATHVLGHPTGAEGYTKLSGNFKLDVFPMTGSGSKLTITDGKFNLSDAISIGW